MTTAVLYVRTSDPDEDLRIDQCLSWAETHQYVVTHIQTDSPSINSLKQRPGLQEGLDLLRREMLFLTYSLEHLSSNQLAILRILEWIAQVKGYFYSLTDVVDEQMDPQIREAIEKVSILPRLTTRKKNHRRVQKTLAADGMKSILDRKSRSRPPYGKQLSNGPRSAWIDNPEEQRVIETIMNLRNTPNERGFKNSYESIAWYLNREGILPKKENGVWTKTMIIRIVQREKNQLNEPSHVPTVEYWLEPEEEMATAAKEGKITDL